MLGERLRELRKAKGYSQAQMALKLHITQGAISQWENGLTTPSAEQLLLIAQVYGTTVDALLGREKPEAPEQAGVPKTAEARTLAAGLDRMTKEQRERALRMVQLMFEQADLWEENGDNAT